MAAERCCDIHAHFIPDSILADMRTGSAIDGVALEDRDGSPWVVHRQGPKYPLQPELYDLEARFAMMDRLGIDVAVVSLSPTLLFYWLESSEAADWARTANDDLARLVASSGGRIEGVAQLPLQDADAAIAELRRAKHDLGLKGVQLAPMVMDRTLDVDDYYPVLEELDRLEMPMILHPYFVGAGDRPGMDKYFMTNLSGHPYATAIGATRLIMSGTLDRLPNLKPVLVHGGGYLPYQIGRLDHGHAVRPEAKACQEKPSSYLRRFTIDTLAHSAPALDYLVGLVGADRVAYGTDFPYDMGGGSAADQLAGVDLDVEQFAQIRGRNGLKLFGLDG
jgi:aminocarboxymuconate-semialdehyde decarboxylase